MGTHRRTPVARRAIAASVILLAGGAGTVLGLHDSGSTPDKPPAPVSLGSPGPTLLTGPPPAVRPSSSGSILDPRTVPPASSAVRLPAQASRSAGSAPAGPGTSAPPSPSLTPSAPRRRAPVSASVSTPPPPVSSSEVRSSTPVTPSVSSSVSPSVSASATDRQRPTPPADSATWTLQQWLDWLTHHRH